MDLVNQFSSVTQSCPTLQPHELQHARLPCPPPTPEACSNSCPSSRWCHPSHTMLSPSPPTFNLSQHQGLLQWVSSSHPVAKVLEFQLQHQFFQWIFRTMNIRMDWLDLLAIQGTLKSLLQHHVLKSINSLVLSFLYSPTVTSIHDYWKNQLSLDGPLLAK